MGGDPAGRHSLYVVTKTLRSEGRVAPFEVEECHTSRRPEWPGLTRRIGSAGTAAARVGWPAGIPVSGSVAAFVGRIDGRCGPIDSDGTARFSLRVAYKECIQNENADLNDRRKSFVFNGGADEDRTHDLLNAIQALSQTELQPHGVQVR